MKITSQNIYFNKTNFPQPKESFKGSSATAVWNKPIDFVHPKSDEYKFKIKIEQINKTIEGLYLKNDLRRLKFLIKDIKNLSKLETNEIAEKAGLHERTLENFFSNPKKNIVINEFSFFDKLFNALSIKVPDKNKKLLANKLTSLKNSGKVFTNSAINDQKQKIIDMLPYLSTKEDFKNMSKELNELLFKQGMSKVDLAKKTGFNVDVLGRCLTGNSIARYTTYRDIFSTLGIKLNEKQAMKFFYKTLALLNGNDVLAGKELSSAKKELIDLIDNIKSKKDIPEVKNKIKTIAEEIGIPFEELKVLYATPKKFGKVETLHNALEKIGVYLDSEKQSILNKKWGQLSLNGFIPNSTTIKNSESSFIQQLKKASQKEDYLKAAQNLKKLAFFNGISQNDIAKGLDRSTQYISRLFTGKRTTRPETYMQIFKFIKNHKF